MCLTDKMPRKINVFTVLNRTKRTQFWLNTEHDFNIHSHLFCMKCSTCQFQLSKAKGSPYVLVSKTLRCIPECQRLWLAASFHVFVGVDSAELPLIKAMLFLSCHCCEEQWRWRADPRPSHTTALGKKRACCSFTPVKDFPMFMGQVLGADWAQHTLFGGDLHSHSTVGPGKQTAWLHPQSHKREISHPTAWFASINQICLGMQTESRE